MIANLPSKIAFPGEFLCEVILRTCCSQSAPFERVGDGLRSSAERAIRFGSSRISSWIDACPVS
jgi:hypothetical protein